MRVETRRGFTLLELMLVVGIIGVIASVAIPNFISYQARSRRSEAYTNLSALARAQKAFQAERNAYLDTAVWYPDPTRYNGGILGATTMPWDADAQAAFAELGWGPEGKVYYSYASYTNVSGGGCNTCDLCFTGVAYGDVDGNGFIQGVMYVHPEEVGGATVECTEPFRGWGAPFDPGSGLPIYDGVAVRSNSDF